MSLFHRILNRLGQWRKDESGSIAVETIMMVPLLAWALLSTLAYFDAYRFESINNKAGLTIADMVSRETGYVTDTYLDGARDLLKFLTHDDAFVGLRVTVVRWDETDKLLRRVWSVERGPRDGLTEDEVKNLVNKVPKMSDAEVLIVVETWNYYEPAYSVGLSPMTMSTFTFISPRFVSQLCYKPLDLTPDEDAIC